MKKIVSTYELPPLNDILLKNIIFSMENQKFKGYLDLITSEVIEIESITDEILVLDENNKEHKIPLKIIDNKERFMLVPPWGPLEGFKMRELFSVSLKNPIYKERLDKTLHTGRGVFRKFKDVLHSQPAIERQWYDFKADYMKKTVVEWYEYNRGIIKLESLPVDIEELPNDLLLEDFQIVFDKNHEYLQEILGIKKNFIEKLSETNKLLITRRQFLLNNAKHLLVLTPDNKIIGFIEYEKINLKINEITAYGIVEEYRGIGLFNLLLDKLIRQLKREKFNTLLYFSLNNCEKTLKFSEKEDIICNLYYCTVDIDAWTGGRASSEMLEV